jgi:hypothetical protein
MLVRGMWCMIFSFATKALRHKGAQRISWRLGGYQLLFHITIFFATKALRHEGAQGSLCLCFLVALFFTCCHKSGLFVHTASTGIV